MPLDYTDYERGKRALQVDHDARLALGSYAAFIRLDEQMSIPGYAGDDGLTAARDAMRATATDTVGAHLEAVGKIAQEAGLAIGDECLAAADRLLALYEATDGAKRARERKAADGAKRARERKAADERLKVLGSIVRPEGAPLTLGAGRAS